MLLVCSSYYVKSDCNCPKLATPADVTLVTAPTCIPDTVCLQNEGFDTINSTAYKIDVNLQLTNVDQTDAFAAALSRWQGIITESDSPFNTTTLPVDVNPPGTCTNPIPEIVSSIYVCGEIKPIINETGGVVDGVVGVAGPTLLRPRNSTTNITGTTIMGFVQLSPDVVDDGIFLDTIIHELGHVFGIGMFNSEFIILE